MVYLVTGWVWLLITQVRYKKGQIETRTVKYKGCINGVPGDWVGVALDYPGKV